MIGKQLFRCVRVGWLVVLPLGSVSSPSVAAQSADAICSEVTPAGVHGIRYYEALSRGGKVVGTPLHEMEARFNACHWARWNDPVNDMLRMIVFVYNDSNRAFFNEARLTVWAETVRARVTSGPIAIGPKRTGVFLFVGPLRRISLGGIYGGPRIRFDERAPPSTCGTLTLDQALLMIEAFDPNSEVRSSIPNLDVESEVGVIRIQFDESVLQESATSQATTERLAVQLYENRQDAAFIECS